MDDEAKDLELSRIGQALRELREQKGLTLQAAADRMGSYRSALSRIENGGRDPRISTVLAYLRAMGYTLRELVEVLYPSWGYLVLPVPVEETQERQLPSATRPINREEALALLQALEAFPLEPILTEEDAERLLWEGNGEE